MHFCSKKPESNGELMKLKPSAKHLTAADIVLCVIVAAISVSVPIFRNAYLTHGESVSVSCGGGTHGISDFGKPRDKRRVKRREAEDRYRFPRRVCGRVDLPRRHLHEGGQNIAPRRQLDLRACRSFDYRERRNGGGLCIRIRRGASRLMRCLQPLR